MKMRIRIDEKDFEVEIINIHARPVIAKVDGEPIEVWPEETAEKKSEIQGVRVERTTPESPPKGTGSAGNGINAPLPGVIVSIEVKAGDIIKQGQALCTLEAMKMKNAIRSTRDGVVADIHVNPGDLVKHGQLLISFKA